MTELVGFRVASWDTPLRVNPNRQPGRFNYAGSGATQYIALHPLASWAEYMRWHDLREPGALSEIRLGVWVIRIIVQDLLVLDYNNAQMLGTNAESLISDDWSRCQELAQRLRADRRAPEVLATWSSSDPELRSHTPSHQSTRSTYRSRCAPPALARPRACSDSCAIAGKITPSIKPGSAEKPTS
jgi:hypothetical protein